MRREELDRRLRAVVRNREAVARELDRPKTRQRRKCSHSEVLDDFLMSGDFRQTALAFGLSPTGVYSIVRKAIYIAERLADRPPEPAPARPAKGIH